MTFVVWRAFDTYKLPVILAVAFERVRVFAKTLVVVMAFDTYRLPVMLAVAFARVRVFALSETPEMVLAPVSAPYRVDATTEPITLIVDVAFARVRVFAKTFVIVTAFDTYKLPVILAVAFARVRVLANMFVVETAFDTYTLPVILAVAFARVMVFALSETPEMAFAPVSAPYKVDATTVPTTLILDVAFERVRVLANMFVVATALDANTFPETHKVGPDAGGAEAVPIPTGYW